MHVLVVDDSPVNVAVAVGMLNNLGLHAATLTNGRECLEYMQENTPDVILMDCQMPELDGFETAKRIRTNKHICTQPLIIAMTAFGLSHDRSRCLDAGMDGYLAKAFSKNQLIAALNTLTHNRTEQQ